MDKRLLSSEQAGSEIIPVDAIGDRSPRKALTDEVGAAGLRMQRFRAAQRPTIRAANEQEALACSCVAVVGAATNLVIELESASLQCGDPCAEVFALPGLDRLTCAGVARPPHHVLGNSSEAHPSELPSL